MTGKRITRAAASVAAAVLIMLAREGWGQVEVEWERTYSGTSCSSAIRTTDGGFALAGEFQGDRWQDFHLVKTDSDGDSLWSRTYGGSLPDECYEVIQTSDGGFALAGYTTSFGAEDHDFWLVKTDANGDSLWSHLYGGPSQDHCRSIIETNDGGFLMTGYFDNLAWVLRVDVNGDSLWSRFYGEEGRSSEFGSIVRITGGDLVLSGAVRTGAEMFRPLIVRISENGEEVWARQYDERKWLSTGAVIQATDGSLVMCGSADFYNDENEYDRDILLYKISPDGELIWLKSYGGSQFEQCSSIIETSDRGFALAGSTIEFDTDSDCLILRVNSEGDSLWVSVFGGLRNDNCNSVFGMDDGSYIISGTTETWNDVWNDFYLVKTTPDPVSVRESSPLTPQTLLLDAAYPNPFNSTTRIGYSTSGDAYPTRLTVFDPLGRRVAELIPPGTAGLPAGRHSVVWNAAGVPAGEYLIRLQAGEEMGVTKVQVVK